MSVPIFQALLDIQNLSRIHPDLSFTQTVHLHIKNNQLELPVSTTLHVSDNSIVSDAFVHQLDQLLRVYETALFAIVVEAPKHTFARRIYEADDELYTVGTDDESKTHFVYTVKITDSTIQQSALLPVSRSNPPGYSPSIAHQLSNALDHFNKALH